MEPLADALEVGESDDGCSNGLMIETNASMVG